MFQQFTMLRIKLLLLKSNMKREGIIIYPKYLNSISEYIGTQRSKSNIELVNSVLEFNRGERDIELNVLGVKGELIFAHQLFTLGIDYELNVLCADKPVVGCDIIIGNYRIDVKASYPQSKSLLVNERSHHKAKDITHYAFVQLLTDTTARYWIFEKQLITNWELRKMKFTNAYYKQI